MKNKITLSPNQLHNLNDWVNYLKKHNDGQSGLITITSTTGGIGTRLEATSSLDHNETLDLTEYHLW